MLSVMTLIVFIFITVMAYFFTNGFRNNEEFCSKYIQKLNNYNSKNGHYPSSLNQLEKPLYSYRYDQNICNYNVKSNTFSFMVSSGFGVAIYSSQNNSWVYD